jgi:hypothetical protein
MQTAHPDRSSDGPLIFQNILKITPGRDAVQFAGGISGWNDYFAAE